MSELNRNQQVVYVYDGTFEGFLCCVYNYYYNRLKPVCIVAYKDFTPSFYDSFIVETDYEQAYKVRYAIEEKISTRALKFLTECMLTSLDEKEMYMLRFVVKGLKKGDSIINDLADSDVNILFKAHRHLERESHHFLGWVRFYKAGDVYVSKIRPKNYVLSLITWHFTTRFRNQPFMIYDETHHQALFSANGKHTIMEVDNIQMPELDENERLMQALWKNFYDTIAIKERYNPKCRMNFMPKRLWSNLPEMQETKNTKQICE